MCTRDIDEKIKNASSVKVRDTSYVIKVSESGNVYLENSFSGEKSMSLNDALKLAKDFR